MPTLLKLFASEKFKTLNSEAPPEKKMGKEEKSFYNGDKDPDAPVVKHFKSGFHPKRFIPEHHQHLEKHGYSYKGKVEENGLQFHRYKRHNLPGHPRYHVTVREKDGAWLGGGPGMVSTLGQSSEDLGGWLGKRHPEVAQKEKDAKAKKPGVAAAAKKKKSKMKSKGGKVKKLKTRMMEDYGAHMGMPDMD